MSIGSLGRTPGGTHRRALAAQTPAYPRGVEQSGESRPRSVPEFERLALTTGHDEPALAGRLRVENPLECIDDIGDLDDGKAHVEKRLL